MEIIQKPFYRDITKRFYEAKQEIEVEAQRGVRDDVIQENIDKLTEELEQKLAVGLEKYVAELEADLQKLKESYKVPPAEYTDPTAELLKRQDFELKLKTSLDRELQEQIQKADDLNEWELRTLILAAENRLPAEGGTLLTKLQVKLQENGGGKWVNDPKFKGLSTPLARASTHPKGAIALSEDGYTSFKEISPLLQETFRMNRRK